MIMQNEICPTSKKLHIQGALWFENAKTFTATKALFPERVHLEIARGTARKNRVYCTKRESRATGVHEMSFESGTMPRQGQDGVFGEMMADVMTHTEGWMWINYGEDFGRSLRTLREYRNTMTEARAWQTVTTVYYGVTGVGKSRRAIQEAGPDAYFMIAHQEGRPIWIDGYHGQKNVIIEDYSGGIGYRLFLRMLDRHPVTMEIKGGQAAWIPIRIWITSNKHPQDWYGAEDYAPLKRRLLANGGKIVELK